MRESSAHDQHYLRTDQYRDSSNLDARKALHVKYSVNKGSWFIWVFDQLELPQSGHLLELGTGPGDLWTENAGRVPERLGITLSDFSLGMLATARQKLAASQLKIDYATFDAQSIPLADESCDVAVANHMLYHVPDRPRALREIDRILKPGGRLYAATNGDQNMQAMDDLIEAATGRTERAWSSVGSRPFTLGNGRKQLAEVFAHVDVTLREDGLRITDVQPLIDYVLSGSRWLQSDPAAIEALRAYAQTEIDRSGAILIDKSIGLFVATKNS